MKIKKRHIYEILFGIVFIILVLIIVDYVRETHYRQIMKNPVISVAKLVEYSPGKNCHLEYLFYANDKKYTGITGCRLTKVRDSVDITIEGKYLVVYSRKNPKKNIILYNYPIENFSLGEEVDSISIEPEVIKEAINSYFTYSSRHN